jgi:hypothetical protein
MAWSKTVKPTIHNRKLVIKVTDIHRLKEYFPNKGELSQGVGVLRNRRKQ